MPNSSGSNQEVQLEGVQRPELRKRSDLKPGKWLTDDYVSPWQKKEDPLVANETKEDANSTSSYKSVQTLTIGETFSDENNPGNQDNLFKPVPKERIDKNKTWANYLVNESTGKAKCLSCCKLFTMDTRGKSGYRIKSSMTSHSEKCSPSVKLTVVEEVKEPSFADCRGPEKDVLFQQEIQKQLMAQVPTRSEGMVTFSKILFQFFFKMFLEFLI